MLSSMSFLIGSGNASADQRQKIETIVREFEQILAEKSSDISPRIIRAKIQGSIFILVDSNKIAIFYVPKHENRVHIDILNKNIQPSMIAKEISENFDTDDISVVIMSSAVLHENIEVKNKIFSLAADEYIKRSTQAHQASTMIDPINPIFGPNKWIKQQNLIFVIMPFAKELNQIYSEIIKPSIEEIGMVCRRADEIKGNNSIMSDIWKSICESRIVVADLTKFNPNVMYELGIAHTVGKPTLIVYQEDVEKKDFPFDLAHIRRINYNNDAKGGVRLRNELKSNLNAMIEYETGS